MSETLIPTMALRFVRRVQNGRIALILQQGFKTTGGRDVWRDVPVVEDTPDE